MTRIVELFGSSTSSESKQDWRKTLRHCECPFLGRTCIKNRKSDPEIRIGTCTVANGKLRLPVIICPHRLLERRQIFIDSMHLMTKHEPGNEIHLIPEVTIPGGSVDYFLVSAGPDGRVRDFVGIELQTLDTTGTVWPERQRFLQSVGVPTPRADRDCADSFGMNWKMTAKTILMQLHHKIETFENVGKHLVLVVQDHLLVYMEREFTFAHLSKSASVGDAMHFHAYSLTANTGQSLKLQLTRRHSTDAAGVATALGMKGTGRVALEEIFQILQSQISASTLFNTDHFTGFTPATMPS
jgi:hypothetical protein